MSDNFYSWYVRQNGNWVSTTDPNDGAGPVNASKWNGGTGGFTPWCQGGGNYMFGEDPNHQCDQIYDGLSLSSTLGLSMQSNGGPSAVLQTGGSDNGNGAGALFIQKYGYWEASFEVPSANDGEGGYANHSDFWMHPIPTDTSSPLPTCVWSPEFDIGERPTWTNYATNNQAVSFFIADCNGNGPQGYYGAVGSPDLSQSFHKYGLAWINDGSGPYGSMQIYLDGVPLLGSPWVLSSANTAMANGITSVRLKVEQIQLVRRGGIQVCVIGLLECL